MTTAESRDISAVFRLSDLAALVGGRLLGDGDLPCHGANPPQVANPGEITLLDDPRRFNVIESSQAIAVVTSQEVPLPNQAQIIVDQPHYAFGLIVAQFRPAMTSQWIGQQLPAQGIHPTAIVDPTATIHASAIIGAGTKIGKGTLVMPGAIVLPRCTIGDDCIIHSSVTLYEYTSLGDRVVIHSGSVLGANGFGYRQQEGKHVPTSQLGYVAIESDVEIGAGVTIDRGTYGATRIGEGTKIDNQVQIAHNCQIGRHNLICSQVGVAGSCRTGDYVVMAGQVGLKDHIILEDHVVIGAQAGVMDNCSSNSTYLGSPATPIRHQMQILAVVNKLPELRKEVKRLQRELQELQELTRGDRSNHRAA